MNSEVDTNVLVNHYTIKRLATLVNQNILLEAKMESATKRIPQFTKTDASTARK